MSRTPLIFPDPSNDDITRRYLNGRDLFHPIPDFFAEGADEPEQTENIKQRKGEKYDNDDD